MESLFCCPLCLGNLERSEGRYHCSSGHSFDVALGRLYSSLARQPQALQDPVTTKRWWPLVPGLLERGHYAPLLSALCAAVLDQVTASSPVLLDSGCGEGYYTAGLHNALTHSGGSPEQPASISPNSPCAVRPSGFPRGSSP